MNCRIELINSNNNKTEKQMIISGTYFDCENKVSELNKKKTKNKKWVLTEINCN